MELNRNRFKYFFGIYIVIIGAIGQFAPYLQAHKIYMTQSAGDLSVVAVVISFVSVASWLVYGFFIKDVPLMISNVIGIIGATLLMVGIFIYG